MGSKGPRLNISSNGSSTMQGDTNRLDVWPEKPDQTLNNVKNAPGRLMFGTVNLKLNN